MKPGDKILNDKDWFALPEGSVVELAGEVVVLSSRLSHNGERADSNGLWWYRPSEEVAPWRLVSLPSFPSLHPDDGAPDGIYVDSDGDPWLVKEDLANSLDETMIPRARGWSGFGPFQYVGPLGGWPSERGPSLAEAVEPVAAPTVTPSGGDRTERIDKGLADCARVLDLIATKIRQAKAASRWHWFGMNRNVHVYTLIETTLRSYLEWECRPRDVTTPAGPDPWDAIRRERRPIGADLVPYPDNDEES